jgi:purine-binding chemotaxis protein CheW
MNNHTIQDQPQSTEGANSESVLRTLQLFQAGGSQFGVFTDDIATIVAWREPTPLPQAPRSVLGVVSIQGRMLTVLDLAILQDGEAASGDAAAEHLIALRGDEQLALAVDAVGETIQLAPVNFADVDAKETTGTLVRKVLHREGAQINIINLKELFPAAIQGRQRRRRRF